VTPITEPHPHIGRDVPHGRFKQKRHTPPMHRLRVVLNEQGGVNMINALRELTISELCEVSGGILKSDATQILIDRMAQAIAAKAGSSGDSAGTDRRRAGLDNIQKMLDILHGMNPSI
jgi:hypothetical protein